MTSRAVRRRRACVLGVAAAGTLALASCGLEWAGVGRPAALPAPTPWAAGAQDPSPEVKAAAVGAVEAAARLDAALPPGLAASAGALRPPVPAVAQVGAVQYTGLLDDSAAVLVDTRVSWLEDEELRTRDVTADVRLELVGDVWSVVAWVTSTGEGSGATGAAAPSGALLDRPGLDLTAAAAGDLRRGAASAQVTEALEELLRGYDLGVATFAAGHPREVFGQPYDSNHTAGLAVDVWTVEGRRVVDMPLDDPVLLRFLQDVRSTGANEIGAPVDPDGPGRFFFANALHRDHVHIGFDPEGPF